MYTRSKTQFDGEQNNGGADEGASIAPQHKSTAADGELRAEMAGNELAPQILYP